MKTLHIPCDPGEISDGYHTFNELYDHRCTLFLALMASNPALSWISAKHHDGSEWEGWFIAGMELPSGDVTYHLPNSMMGAAMQTGCRVMKCGKEWDGHTAADVVSRLREWVHCSPSYFPGMDCQCSARSESECGCPFADWTPTQLRNLRRENAEMRAIIYEVSTGGYTPMQAHEWLKSHPENVLGDGSPDTQLNRK